MSANSSNRAVRLIAWWEATALRHPWWVLLVFAVATGWTLHYAMENLSINANTAEMLSKDLPFQQNRIRLENAFPQDVSAFLMVVEGGTPERTAEAVQRLAGALRSNPREIRSIYIPDDGAFFANNGLLYRGLSELETLSVELANAQPFIGRLSQDFSLDGLLSTIGDALTRQDQDLALELQPLLTKLREALHATDAGQPYRLSWRQLMMKNQAGLGITKRFIIVTPVLRFDELMPAEQSYKAIAAAIDSVKTGTLADIRVRLTGEVMLEYEEMATIGRDMIFAGAGSILLVSVTLWIAYRSLKLMIATVISLTIGLILSLGFATAAIGQLNMISIAFAVMFIGMGDAYSSHFCLRYRELVLRGLPLSQALRQTFQSTGVALMLCTVTAAIGLYAFIPTSYVGVAELGIISGTSMFIALGTTFTVLPALIKIMPLKPASPDRRPEERAPFLVSDWPIRYAAVIRVITLVAAAIAAGLLVKVEVDFNPINLRDPNSESVKTFKYLLQSKDTSPMTLAALAETAAQAREKALRFERLPTVDRVVSVLDWVPEQQGEKLALIQELSLILGSQLAKFPQQPQRAAGFETLERFQATVRAQLAKEKEADPELRALDAALEQFMNRLHELGPEPRQALLDRLQASVLGDLPIALHNLQRSLQAHPITLEDLPEDLLGRWIAKDGSYRLQIFPRHDLNHLDHLRQFIREAQEVDPGVTDLPVTYFESMNAVVRAFRDAFVTAFGAIAVLLLLVLRSVRDTALALLPLLLASLFTAAATVILRIPFNFANIIVLPLLFGLGVDNGIHMVHRLRYLRNDQQNLLRTSEAKGVFYGALTTVFSFVSLAFTHHRGTASIGLLLAIGLVLSLVCSLIVLPAFSTWKLNALRR